MNKSLLFVVLNLMTFVSDFAGVEAQTALDGLYSGIRRSGGFHPDVALDHMVFFPDGTVYWKLPDQGLLAFDRESARNQNPEFWGTYHIRHGSVRIQWASGNVTEGTLEENESIELDGFTYWHRDSADGYSLSGTYRPSNLEPGRDHAITFFQNGYFQDDGVRQVVGLIDLAYGRPLAPADPGTGTYFIAKNSIVLEYEDGRREQLSFYTSDISTSSPDFVVIHSYSLGLQSLPQPPPVADNPDHSAIQTEAEGGDASAQLRMGYLYAAGEGVTQDYAEAARWFRTAAEQGIAEAQWVLGYLYYQGNGVPQDFATAIKWYRLAAEQGMAQAQLSLGHLYRLGQGASRDDREAAGWYRQAAEQGEVEAQYILGALCADGIGVSRDLVQAYVWFDLASSRSAGDRRNEIFTALERIAEGMTHEQIAKAQSLVHEWRDRHPDLPGN